MNGRIALVVAGVLVVVGAITAGGAGAAVRSVRITVKPRTGTPASRFVIGFRAPDTTGHVGALRRSYILSASERTAAGCAANASMTLPPARARTRVRVTLDPKHFGPRWCSGRFHGRIEEIAQPYCPPRRLCPAFVVLIRYVGRFSYRVAAPGGDTQPPSFSGLDRAFACTPGAQRPGETTPFNLSWQPATDNRSPASQLVYDIYMSSARGTENFLRPTWSASPGSTSFRTPGLPSHGVVYFVVRARDQAGNEDGNRVERAGIDACL
jgi:hypothetical protein